MFMIMNIIDNETDYQYNNDSQNQLEERIMSIKKLSSLSKGESGIVTTLEGHGNIQHRLVDMGVVKGTRISVVKRAPLGDPIEVKVKGCALSLRMNEAALIEVACEGGE